MRNGAGSFSLESSLGAVKSTITLQRKRQESCSFRRRRGRGSSENVIQLVKAGICVPPASMASFFLLLSLNPRPVLSNKHISSCLASRRPDSGWKLLTYEVSSPIADKLPQGVAPTTSLKYMRMLVLRAFKWPKELAWRRHGVKKPAGDSLL